MNILIVGKGRVGSAAATKLALDPANTVALASSRDASDWGAIRSADILLLAVRDDAITDVARKVLSMDHPSLKFAAHFSGASSFEILPAGKFVRAAIHPLYPFPKTSSSTIPWMEISLMVSPENSEAREIAEALAKSLGASGTFEIPTASIPLYHAMCVFASNFPVLLIGAVEEITKALGDSEGGMKERLTPLVITSVATAMTEPAHSALTGPIMRGDFRTIEKHEAALEGTSEAVYELYQAFIRFSDKMGYFPPDVRK